MVESVGENKEFGVATLSDVTVYFTNNSSKTSADDTATEKYVDRQGNITKICIRADQTFLITKINGMTLTSPITIIIGTAWQENYVTPFLGSVTVRTTVENTNVKARGF